MRRLKSIHLDIPLRSKIQEINNVATISRTHGKITMSCPICFILFERFACHVRPGQISAYCSRACAGKGSSIRGTKEVNCVVCGKKITLTKSNIIKGVLTCSDKCSSKRKSKVVGRWERTDKHRAISRRLGKAFGPLRVDSKDPTTGKFTQASWACGSIRRRHENA